LAIVSVAALPSVVEPKTKQRVWSGLYACLSLTAIPCRTRRIVLHVRG
jgi:hypothetical protein